MAETRIPDEIWHKYPGLRLIAYWPEEEVYRFLIDGRKHAIENGYMEYGAREPGCIFALYSGLQHALANIEDPSVSIDLMQNIHTAVTKDTHIVATPGRPRQKSTIYPIYKNLEKFKNKITPVREEDIEELQLKLKAVDAVLITDHNLVKNFVRNKEDFESSFDAFKEWKARNPGMVSWEMCPEKMYVFCSDKDNIQALWQQACDKYNNGIQARLYSDPRLKLMAISEFIQEIERIHGFPNANGRVAICLLQRLLIQNGFPPTMLNNPNNIDTYNQQSLIQEILDGIERTQTFDKSKGVFMYVTPSIEDTYKLVKNKFDKSKVVSEYAQATNMFREFQNFIREKPNFTLLDLNQLNESLIISELIAKLNQKSQKNNFILDYGFLKTLQTYPFVRNSKDIQALILDNIDNIEPLKMGSINELENALIGLLQIAKFLDWFSNAKLILIVETIKLKIMEILQSYPLSNNQVHIEYILKNITKLELMAHPLLDSFLAEMRKIVVENLAHYPKLSKDNLENFLEFTELASLLNINNEETRNKLIDYLDNILPNEFKTKDEKINRIREILMQSLIYKIFDLTLLEKIINKFLSVEELLEPEIRLIDMPYDSGEQIKVQFIKNKIYDQLVADIKNAMDNLKINFKDAINLPRFARLELYDNEKHEVSKRLTMDPSRLRLGR